MEEDARAYSKLNKPLYRNARLFVDDLSLKKGSKVLHMGCRTGNVTKHIADIVGPNGAVIGVDSDYARVNVAKEYYDDIENIEFFEVDSHGEFPHFNESYYDAHISTHFFHWLTYEKKKTYIEKVHASLKSGGKLCISCCENHDLDERGSSGEFQMHGMPECEIETFLQDVGSFINVFVKRVSRPAYFDSYDLMKRWFKAATHQRLEDEDPNYLKNYLSKRATFYSDGSVSLNMKYLEIIAFKP